MMGSNDSMDNLVPDDESLGVSDKNKNFSKIDNPTKTSKLVKHNLDKDSDSDCEIIEVDDEAEVGQLINYLDD